MPLNPIQRRDIKDPVRAAYQERTARAVESDPEPFLAAYQARADTHGGRYVAADLMKEVFPEFSASRAGRTEHNVPLHNSAAVLASEQFRRAVADTSHPERTRAIFVTGIPGAGKTSAVLDNRQLRPDVRVVYEGQLASPGPAIEKIQSALDAGLRVDITAIHVQPEVALENTFGRFEREGRGAGYLAMASVQGNLPDGLAAIHEHFGDKVSLTIIDRREDMNAARRLAGWQHLGELRSEGNYEQIKQRLITAIDRHEAAGIISPAALNEARGNPPLRTRGLHHGHDPQPGHPPAGSAARPERAQLHPAGVQPGAVSPTEALRQPTVRFGGRENTVRLDAPRRGQEMVLRLHDAATGDPGTRVSADAPQHPPAAGNVMVKNYGENAGLAEALAQSGAFAPQKEVLGGMLVEMEVVDTALKAQLRTHEHGRDLARGPSTRQTSPGHGR